MIDHYAIWYDLPITVIDFETTGVNKNACGVVQVAAVRFEQGRVRGKYDTLVDPGMPIPHHATKIHGIQDADVEGAPSAEDALASEAMYRVCGGAVLCAYNQEYDSAIASRFGLDLHPDHGPWIDPLVMTRYFAKKQGITEGNKLTQACARWGVTLPNAHDALGDATATGELLWAMHRYIGIMTYGELIRRQRTQVHRNRG